MSSARGARRSSYLRTLLVAGVVAVSTAGPTVAVAAADEPAGTPVVGRLVQAWPEKGPDEQQAAASEATAPLSWIDTADGAVRVPTEDLSGVPAGATVELTVGPGVRDEGAQEHGLEPAQQVLSTELVTPAAAAAPVRGSLTNQVTVVLVAPAGTRPDAGVTAQAVAATVDDTVSTFWSEQTGGAVRFGVTATHEWISTAAGCADPTALWDEAASAVGFESGPGRHLLLYLSSQTATQAGCSYALAEVGTGPSSGGRLYVRDRQASVIAHELGHNLGLSHSSGLQCDGTLETGTCRTAGYRDFYDVMGVSWRQLGSLNAPQAALLGALSAESTLDLGIHDAPTFVVLTPMAAGTGTRAVRLADAEGTDYWLEYRTAAGQDGWLGRSAENRYRLDTGVLLRRSSAFPDTSVLLDGTPTAAAGWDSDFQTALPVDVPMVLSGGDFTVTVRSLADGGAALDVVPAVPAAAVVLPAPGGNGAGQVLTGTDGSGAVGSGAVGPGAVGSGTVGVASAAVTAPPAAVGEPQVAMPWSPSPVTAAGVGTPALDPASGSMATGGLFVALAGAGLTGATLLLVRRARRLRIG